MDVSMYEDLNYRARQVLHYLDRNPDEREGWMPHFGGTIVGGAPAYHHSEWDACDVGWRMVEAYLLVRQILGQKEPEEPERRLRAFVLRTVRDDGLSYRLARPWSQPHAWMWDHGRALLALAAWLRFEPDDRVAALARRMVAGLAAIARREADGDRWFFPAENWTGTAWGDTVYGHPPTGAPIEGMVELAELLGDRGVLDAAGHFVRWVRAARPPLFAADGTVVRRGGGPLPYQFTHLHSRLSIANGLLEYAWATGDALLHEWAERAYAHVRDGLASSFGFVPESLESGPDLGPKARAENCAVVDMMQGAAILAAHGHPEERSTLFRYGLNQLFAHQILDFAPLRHLMASSPPAAAAAGSSSHGLPERFLGCFTGCTHVNELVVDASRPFAGPAQLVDASGCCSPSGAKGLWLLWKEAIRREAETVRVDAWVTLENPDVRVVCAEPARGELRLQMKRPCQELLLAVPEGVEEPAVSGTPAAPEEGGVLRCGPQRQGNEVRVEYRLAERTSRERVAGADYTIRWRGPRVVAVDPPAQHCRHYWWRQRGGWRQNAGRGAGRSDPETRADETC